MVLKLGIVGKEMKIECDIFLSSPKRLLRITQRGRYENEHILKSVSKEIRTIYKKKWVAHIIKTAVTWSINRE